MMTRLWIAAYLTGATYAFGQVWSRTECQVEAPCRVERTITTTIAAIFWPIALSAIWQEGGGA